jgi:hypothetical protein
MQTGGPFTMSCWYNPLATLPSGKQVMGKICTNGITTWTGSYGMVFNGSTPGDLRFNDIVGTASERCHYQLTASTWYHLVWTRIDTGSTAANTNVYVNGALAGGTVTAGSTNARVDSLSWCIGRDCALGTSSTVEYCPGQIAEVQVSNVVRDPGWAAISYQTQLSTSTAVSFGSQTANAIAWPNPPVLATPVNNALNQPLTENFSWVTVTGTATYELQVSGPGDNTFSTTTYDNATLTGTSQTVSGLSYATTYYWRVQGQNSGNSPASTGWSTVNSFTTTVPAPSTPTLSSPTTGSTNLLPTGLSLTWGTVSGAVTYGIQVATSSGFGAGTIVFSSSGTVAVGYVVPTGLAYSTTCYWEVNATNPGGTTAWSGVWSFSTAIPPPGAPVLVSPENGFSTIPLSPNLTWNSVAGATTYELQTAVTTGFSTTVVDQPGIAGTSLGIGPLSYGTVYYWEVRAVNGTGPGAWSAVRSFTSAEDYNDNWSHHLAIPLNTTGIGGANVKNMVTNFPVLVRLTTSNFPGFSQVQSGGKDIRFSGPAPYTKSFPYQIDYWSGTAPNDTAAIWVLMDTIVPGSIAQTLYLHYGNATAPADTSGAQVFDTANGFAGVWHLGTGATQGDATINNRPGTADGLLIDTMGIIGRAKKFTTANNDSIMIGSLMGSPSVVTMSCWAKVDSTDAAGPGTDLMSIGDNADMRVTKQYSSGRDSVSGIYKTGSGAWNLINQPSSGTTLSHNWVYYTYVCNPLAAKPAESLYVNGVKVAGAAATNPIYYSNSHTLFGKNGSGSTSFNLGGVLDEPRIDKVARSTDWINLCFQNQQINQTLLVQTTPAAPILSLPTNNASRQAVSLTFSWGTVSQATGYSVQVSASTSFSSPVFSQSGLTSPIAVAAGLSTGTTYYWQASASNALGAGTWSGIWSFSTALSVPILSLPANGATGQPVNLNLTWGSVNGATTYGVQVSTTSTFSTTVSSQSSLAGPIAAIGGLGYLTTYYWEADAANGGGTSGWSGIQSFTTVIPAPAAPTLANPTNGASAEPLSLNLTWGTVSAATSYGVQVSTASTFGTTVSSQSGLTGATDAISGLGYSTTYYWEANATNAGGVSGWSGLYSFVTLSAPAAPTLTAPASGAINQPTTLALSWTTVANAATYAVQVSTDVSFGSTVTAQWGLTTTSASIAGLANAATYYWRAGAKDPAGVSGWSAPYSFTTIVAAPASAPTLVAPGNDTLNAPASLILTWSTVTNAATYAVQVSLASGFGSTVTAQWGLTGTAASISGLANSTVYFWRAGAKDAGGVSGWSGVWSFTTIMAAPGTPTLAAPSSGVVNQPLSLSLNWGSVPNATYYSLMVSTATNFATTASSQTGLTGITAALSGLANLTTYYWEVNAANVGGMSNWSAAWSFTTIIAAPAVPVLATPTSGAVNAPTSPVLSWTTVTSAATYAVQVSTDAGFGSTVTAQWGLTGTSASITGLANSATYFWRAGAKNIAGVSGWSGAWSFTTIIAAPGVPALASPTNGAANQPVSLSLNWGASATATSYGVMVSTAANFATTVSSQTGLTGVTAALSGLANLTTCYWEVNAANIGGTSGWSGAWSFTTIVAAPIAPTLASPTTGAIDEPMSLSLTWGTVPGAASYALMVSTAANFTTTILSQAGLTGVSASLAGLADGTTYYWEVNATNSGGTGLWSSTGNFTTLVNFSLAVEPGWNMISFNIRPADSSAAAVFGDSATVAGGHNFILVKNLEGAIYSPTLGIRDSITVQTGVGFQMYSNAPDTIHTSGSAIPAFSTQIPLLQGWNLTGYLPTATEPVSAALATISPQLLIVKDNDGDIYFPEYGIDVIDTLAVGQGYFIYMTSSAPLTYSGVAKRAANAGSLLRLPKTTHYAKHANTGNNASVVASLVSFGSKAAPDSCEIGAFDGSGNLVGSGTVIHGRAAFPVWGKNIRTQSKDGLVASENIIFKMWNKTKEYPVEFRSGNGTPVRYSAQAVFVGSFAVPEGALINEFDLSRAYPNPFSGSVKIAFDVPTIAGISRHAVEINVYDLKGSLVKQLAKGIYQAGHYDLSWNCGEGKAGAVGTNVYIVRMKAAHFEKRITLVKMP